MDKQSVRHEFKVVIEGISLSPEIVERLNEAVQRVVLKEIANIDLHGNLALRIPSTMTGIGNGRTQGIWVRALTEEQVRELGLE